MTDTNKEKFMKGADTFNELYNKRKSGSSVSDTLGDIIDRNNITDVNSFLQAINAICGKTISFECSNNDDIKPIVADAKKELDKLPFGISQTAAYMELAASAQTYSFLTHYRKQKDKEIESVEDNDENICTAAKNIYDNRDTLMLSNCTPELAGVYSAAAIKANNIMSSGLRAADATYTHEADIGEDKNNKYVTSVNDTVDMIINDIVDVFLTFMFYIIMYSLFVFIVTTLFCGVANAIIYLIMYIKYLLITAGIGTLYTYIFEDCESVFSDNNVIKNAIKTIVGKIITVYRNHKAKKDSSGEDDHTMDSDFNAEKAKESK